MSKTKNWTKVNPPKMEDVEEEWQHDLNEDVQVFIESGNDIYVVSYRDIDAEVTGTIVSERDQVTSINEARSRAVDWMENHPLVVSKGDKVPIMTEHQDVTTVAVVDPEIDRNTVVIRALEDDKRIGFMEGEETAVDQQQIIDAMKLKPYQRRRLENEFQKQQNMMEGRE